MLGLMQDHALLVTNFIRHAARFHATAEIVSVTVAEGTIRYTYKDCEARARRLASALEKYGIRQSDRIGTLAWNTHRHFEIWYGVSGMGAVTHTINPRLFHDQIVYIANHAEDRLLFVDLTFVPILEAILPQLKSVEAVVLLTDAAHMPETKLPKVICYEDFLASGDADYVWPTFDERLACGLCYTSGTTGNPKGVLYSHRSATLHTYGMGWPDVFGVSAKDTLLPVVPMFHANAWGAPYLAAAVGAKLVLPGADLTGPTLHKLIVDEGVTHSAGVPTVWLGLLQHVEQIGGDFGKMRETVIGGSAAPRAMIETFKKKYGVRVCHAWGMTEMSPLGTLNSLSQATMHLDEEAQLDLACKQGRAVQGVDMKITDDEGNELPWDGKAFGHLKVRGPWVVQRYFRADQDAVDDDGWFDTGDVATIDPNGYMQITDRSKDVIKSGGEWISSIDLENAAVAHPKVVEAAVIGVPHPKWAERPLLIVVLKPGETLEFLEMLDFLSTRVAKWWLPDDMVIVDEIPHTATGKIQKMALREKFGNYVLKTVAAD